MANLRLFGIYFGLASSKLPKLSDNVHADAAKIYKAYIDKYPELKKLGKKKNLC